MYFNYINSIIRNYKKQIKEPTAKLDSLPTLYDIEPLNYCNLKCPGCSTEYITENKRYLRTDEFVKIIEQITSPALINLYRYGEPFLSPVIFELISEGKKRGHVIGVHSNLNIKPELLPKIANSGLDSLSASIDGTSKESYDRFRIKGNFELALSNFKELARLRSETKKPQRLVWQFIVCSYNENEMQTAKDIAAQLPGNVKVFFIPMGFRQDLVDFEQYSDEELSKLLAEWMPKDPKNKKHIVKFFLNPKQGYVTAPTICPYLWNSMTLSVHGDVTPCCFTYKKEHSFGNVNESSLMEIWNNEAYQSSRMLFIDPSYKGCKTVCAKCHNYLRLGKGNFISRNYRFSKWLINKIIEKKNAFGD